MAINLFRIIKVIQGKSYNGGLNCPIIWWKLVQKDNRISIILANYLFVKHRQNGFF